MQGDVVEPVHDLRRVPEVLCHNLAIERDRNYRDDTDSLYVAHFQAARSTEEDYQRSSGQI